MTESNKPQLSYNGTVISAYSAEVSSMFSNVVVVVVEARSVSLSTSYNRVTDSALFSIDKAVDVSGQQFNLYTSNTELPSAGGVISDLTIMGKRLVYVLCYYRSNLINCMYF